MDLLPEQILSMLVEKIHSFTLQHYSQHNKKSSEEVEVKYVFAIPPSFTSAQLSAIKDACKISGITNVEFVSDITAAIINYVYFRGVDSFKEKGKKLLFLSMGHSYFTSQIVELKGNEINVLSSVSSSNLGARNFDFALFDYAKEEFKKKSGFDITGNPKSLNRVLKACEKCKQVLSTINETDLIVEALYNDKDLHIKVNRQLFEDLNDNSLKLLESQLSKLITEAGIASVDDLDGVEVYGGGIRIPVVQNRIKTIVKKDLLFGISAQAVALGASLYVISPESQSS
jgi:molecular chaperone DnaK (HSP70)